MTDSDNKKRLHENGWQGFRDAAKDLEDIYGVHIYIKSKNAHLSFEVSGTASRSRENLETLLQAMELASDVTCQICG